MSKSIAIFSKKGGVGKSSVAHSIARDFGYYLVSNDDSVIEDSYEGMAAIMKEIKPIEGHNIVYDLGGFVDKNVIDILRSADLIIVPTIADINSFKRTINTVKEVSELNKNILIIGNIVKGKEQIEFIKEYIPAAQFFIRDSKIFQRAFIEKKSVTEIVNESNFNKYIYRNIFEDYSRLLNYINEEV